MMNKILLSVFSLGFALALSAQQTKPGTKPPVKPVTKPVTTTGNPLKNNTDSVSYGLGEVAAYGLMGQGLGDIKINNAAFIQALNDILGKKQPLISDSIANAVLNAHVAKGQAEKSKTTIAEGQKFLAQNKLKPNVKTTASGLQYEVLTMGNGIKPAAVDTFVAHYRGTLLNGTEFDASYNRGQPLTMAVNQVIKGWTEGLQLMPVGSKFRFWIPYELAYGTHGQGTIPGGAMLIFEVELLDVIKKK
jgi:FKBP-type peptidyl-prolyl cis-trans isomerase FklB